MTLITIAGPNVAGGVIEAPRPYELGRVIPSGQLAPEQTRALGRQLGIPEYLMPAEIDVPTVVDGYVERLEARKPGRVDEIQAQEAEMSAFAAYRRKRGLWQPEPGTPYRDLQGQEHRSTRWGDSVSQRRFLGPSGILGDEAIRVWATGVPRAVSLIPLADPEKVTLVSGRGKGGGVATAEATNETREWMTACTDAWEIRNRGAILAEEFRGVIQDHVAENPSGTITMVSVAAGTLLPTLQAAVNSGHDHRIRIVMLENDPSSIAMAEQLANELGFRGDLDIREVDVFRPEQMEAQLQDLEGQALTVDAVGIYEYVNEKLRASMAAKMGDDSLLFDPVAFFKMINRFTAADGTLVLGQMRSDRPNGDFTSGVIGWPFVVRRPPAQVMEFAVAGGAERRLTKLAMTPMGVYTMLITRKPKRGAMTDLDVFTGGLVYSNGAAPVLGATAMPHIRPAAPPAEAEDGASLNFGAPKAGTAAETSSSSFSRRLTAAFATARSAVAATFGVML